MILFPLCLVVYGFGSLEGTLSTPFSNGMFEGLIKKALEKQSSACFAEYRGLLYGAQLENNYSGFYPDFLRGDHLLYRKTASIQRLVALFAHR